MVLLQETTCFYIYSNSKVFHTIFFVKNATKLMTTISDSNSECITVQIYTILQYIAMLLRKYIRLHSLAVFLESTASFAWQHC
jgi:hypothetical protein